MRTFIILLTVTVLGALLQGCITPVLVTEPDSKTAHTGARVDFTDPVLNGRQILLFGSIDQRAAELTIQKLLFLEGKSHDPIDLYLQTPGGETKDAFAIEETIRLVRSPVNTYALSECSSGGAMLLAAGTGRRRAFHGAWIMIHGLKVEGKLPSRFVQMVQDTYTDFWRKHSRLPKSWLPLPFGSEHFLSAEQALEYGIIDEIIDR